MAKIRLSQRLQGFSCFRVSSNQKLVANLRRHMQAISAKTIRSATASDRCWHIKAGILSLATAAIFLILSAAQAGASVEAQITNKYVGGGDQHTYFQAGDYFDFVLSGCAAYSQVILDGWSPGYADSNGEFKILNHLLQSGDVGTYYQNWSCGGVNATPYPLNFYVYLSIASCPTITANGSGATMVTDDYFTYVGSNHYAFVGSSSNPSQLSVSWTAPGDSLCSPYTYYGVSSSGVESFGYSPTSKSVTINVYNNNTCGGLRPCTTSGIPYYYYGWWGLFSYPYLYTTFKDQYRLTYTNGETAYVEHKLTCTNDSCF